MLALQSVKVVRGTHGELLALCHCKQMNYGLRVLGTWSLRGTASSGGQGDSSLDF